jgi:aminopeptidase N
MIHPTKKVSFLSCAFSLLLFIAHGQVDTVQFTHADTLRGSLNAERMYNVLKYEISFTPDFNNKSVKGQNVMTYNDSGLTRIQIDLQVPLDIDSIIQNGSKLNFLREGNAFRVDIRNKTGSKISASQENGRNGVQKMTIYYHGNPQVAVKPPWDGGFVFTRDSLGRPWMSVACEGVGASIWYPCKDYLGDEPDSGATLTMIIPDTLTGIGNGRLIRKYKTGNGLTAWTWGVVNPINNYNIIPYIGKYVNWHKTFYGQKGNLDCNFWVLDYDMKKAIRHFTVVDSMLSCFEYWFGPYPFYEDGYKLVEAPYLGMEHQSNIAYGNRFLQGYLGKDLSETGWGLKWDFIIVHESGHEWFGNNITCKDIADEWIHESFTNYSETLYTGHYFGKNAGDDYCIGTRKSIVNLNPIIQYYGVNHEPEGTDQYYKGGNMIHTIRQVIHDEEIFRKIMRGLNQNFYHQTVSALDIQNYINKISGMNFTPVFNQYLRSKEVPVLEYRFEGKTLFYRWTNCNADFNMPVLVDVNGPRWLKPTIDWKKEHLNNFSKPELQVDRNFYVVQRQVH